MKYFHSVKSTALKAALLLSVCSATAAMADDAAPAPSPMTTPAMAGPLSANPNPFGFDVYDYGKVYVGGAVSGMGYYQTSPTKLATGDVASYLDLTNAQVTIQKTDGVVQFYVQAGNYSFPTVGTPYTKSSLATPGSFGVVPEAYLKLQGQGDMSAWSIEGGKLPTLIGDEYNFTFENMNIERGLLWNTEPAISRGVQINYSNGPLNASISLNDGYYSNVLNVLSGVVSYAIAPTDTVAFSASGDLGGPHFSVLNSGSIYNLIWTHVDGNLTISPYFQYIQTPNIGGFVHSTQEAAAAILASYSFNDNWKLAGRFEYENSTGRGFATAPNIIGYGAGSNAWEFTITPTWQYKLLFIRADFSYITAGNGTPGSLFGASLNNTDQARVMLETGIVF